MFSTFLRKPVVQTMQSPMVWGGQRGVRTSSVRKPNLSSLTKHLKPDGLKGYQRRARLQEALRKKTQPVSEKTRGHVPVRFRLGAVESHIAVARSGVPRGEGKVGRKGSRKREEGNANKAFKRQGSSQKGGMSYENGATPKQGCPDDAVFFQLGNEGKTKNRLKEEAIHTTSTPVETSASLIPMMDLPIRTSLSHPAISLVQETLPHGSPLRKASSELLATPIQSSAIPRILDFTAPPVKGSSTDRRHFTLVAEPGTGKTLSYLLPVMEALKREEEAEAPGGGNIRKVERPRALLLAPSTELVAQVSLLSKELSRSVKLRTLMLHSGVKRRTLLRSLEQPVDLVIGNPRVFMSMIEEGIMSVSELRWLVLDEADTLLEKDFAQDVESLLGMMHKVSMNRKQPYTAIAVTATLPRAVHQKMEELLPHATCIATPNVHKTGFKMQHNFVDLKEWNNNKERALLDALKGSTDTTTLVFCNRLNTTEILKASLRSRSMDVEALHKNTEPEARKNILDALGIDSVEDLPVRRSSKSKAPSGNGGEEGKGGEEALPQSSERPPPKVIISTDYASRGLDTSRVGHVIMYDFPTTMVDFLHRSGRTGRANRKGRVTCLVGKKDRRLAERIWRAIKGKTVLS